MKEKVIVLRTIKYGESDLIVHSLNSRGGRLHLIAKGALRSRRRFAGGVLEPSHYIQVTYRVRGAEMDRLHFLEEASLIREFTGLRADYERLDLALKMLDLVEKVTHVGVEDAPEMFDLLGNALVAAERSANLSLLRLQFEAKLIHLQGVLPPDVGFRDLLTHSLKNHEQISLSGELRSRLEWELKVAKERYLHGLTPMDSSGLEV